MEAIFRINNLRKLLDEAQDMFDEGKYREALQKASYANSECELIMGEIEEFEKECEISLD